MPDLTTLIDVKNWQGAIAGNSANADGILSSLITATSADFLRAIERPDLLTATYTEQRVGDGSCRMVLRHWPVTAVASVMIAGTAQDSSTYGIDTSLDPERCYVLYLLGSSTFTDGAPVRVTYSAGYATTPADIAQAVIEWVVLRFNKKGMTGQKNARSNEGERTDVDQEALPPTTQRVIDLYRRKWPAYGRTADQRPGSAKAAPSPAPAAGGN